MACPSRVCLRAIRCAAPGVHKLLTPDGFKGRLWNWRAKPEENRRCGRAKRYMFYIYNINNMYNIYIYTHVICGYIYNYIYGSYMYIYI